jgi:hypothetical protein
MINVRALSKTSAFQLVNGLLVTVCHHAAIFKVVEPLFHLNDPHCIINKSLLNFADCFRLGIPEFLTKLDAVAAPSVLSS